MTWGEEIWYDWIVLWPTYLIGSGHNMDTNMDMLLNIEGPYVQFMPHFSEVQGRKKKCSCLLHIFL
jgi:hypothetical protein